MKLFTQNDPITKDQVTMIIYGYPGLGKTSMAFQCEDPLLLDFDEGLTRAIDRKSAAQIESWQDIRDLRDNNFIQKNGYKTLIIDTVGTALDDYCAEFVMNQDAKNRKKGGGLSLQGYGAMKDEFKSFYNYCKSLKINLIFIAHLKEEKENDSIQIRPNITGGTYDILMPKADLIGHVTKFNQEIWLNFQPTDNAIGKDTAQIGNLKVPKNSDSTWNTFTQKIIDDTIENTNEKSKKAFESQQVVNDYKEKINKCNSADDINILVEELSNSQMEKSVAAIVKKVITDKAKELKLTFNKETKQYENQANPVNS